MLKPDFERRALAAEKTVDVLKHKVRDLYCGGAQTPIHRALHKAQQRDEQNRRRREVAEAREAELRKHSEHLEHEVALRTRAIQTILDHVTFGFLVIDRDLTVREGFTRSCSDLFGRSPAAGEDVGELLRIVGSEGHAELQLTVDQIFEDLLPEEVSLDQMVDRYDVEGRVLHVDVRTVRDDSGAVDALLLTVSDITALETAREQSRQREVLIGILQQKTAFHHFISDTRAALDGACREIEDQPLARRAVHTVKGNAASWGLDSVVSVAHRIESHGVIDLASLAELTAAIREFLERHHQVIAVDYDMTDGAYAVASTQLQQLRAAATDGDANAVRHWVDAVVLRPARELIGPLPAFVAKLAERLGKDVDFELLGDGLLVDAELMRPVLRNLPHLIRNAIDHGIEPSWERGDKAARGRLEVRLLDDGNSWSIQVEDDGRGVPVDVVTRSAVALGLVDEAAALHMSEPERLKLVFLDGVSSAPSMTDVSGRGVGMSSVRAAVRSRIGDLELQSSSAGTCVTMRIPKSESVAQAPASTHVSSAAM